MQKIKEVIDLKKDAETALHLNEVCHLVVTDIKEQLFNRFGNTAQQIMVSHYFRLLHELCFQAGNALLSKAHSSAEALTRVIIEQAANQLYIALDDGARARALLRSSKALTQNNGKNWVEYLKSQELVNCAANTRKSNGDRLVADFDARWPDTEHYPNGRRLFEVLGWGNHYHAFYVPLCDSVHSYSDDMANLVMFYEMSNILKEDLLRVMNAADKERRRLATYHLLLP